MRKPTARTPRQPRRLAKTRPTPSLSRRVAALEASMEPLTDHVAYLEREVLEHDARLSRLERRKARA